MIVSAITEAHKQHPNPDWTGLLPERSWLRRSLPAAYASIGVSQIFSVNGMFKDAEEIPAPDVVELKRRRKRVSRDGIARHGLSCW
jgi:hypothetical protein